MSKIKSPKVAKKPKAINERKPDKVTKKLEKEKKKRRKSLSKKIDRLLSILAVVLAIISGCLDVVAKLINNKKKNNEGKNRL